MVEVLQVEREADYRLYRVEGGNLLPDTYIICADSCRGVLYSPHIAGKKLHEAMEKNSELFARILHKHALPGAQKGSMCELVLLSGGLYYNLNSGFKKLYNFALPQCFIGIQRQRIEGRQGEFRANATYANFESLPDHANVIIGDTVATGSTLIKAIQLLLDAAEERGTAIDSITVVSLAGSASGGRKLSALAKKHIWRENPSCRVSYFACEMLFQLMPDGTDLRFLVPESIMPDESRQEAIARYGEHLSANMKCAVFDWGTRCKNPSAHYKDFLQYAESELANTKLDEKGKRVLLGMKMEVEGALGEFAERLG